MGPARRPTRIVLAHTVVCVLAIVPSVFVQMATVMGGAAEGAGRLGATIAMLGLFLPFVPAVSIAGSWICLRWRRLSLAFVVAAWIYWLLLAVLTGWLFLGA